MFSGTILVWKSLQNILDLELIKFLLEVMQSMLQKSIQELEYGIQPFFFSYLWAELCVSFDDFMDIIFR